MKPFVCSVKFGDKKEGIAVSQTGRGRGEERPDVERRYQAHIKGEEV